ncbi:hypothetical protein GDO86_008185 [Hymenochirus boettgeri]|uniref:G-patch domain-containing protein n=1 Tax=Hymenochirus boettgeri TaxID=247094 RepID=A0A8T2J240_9PIPI|nr:hypothetical protein GDO86_008185 [Hymenochirus boettgeri]
MAAKGSDSEEDFVSYGKPLELYEEGEQPKKPIPLQEQTVKDEKGRYKRFHGAFTGGFSAGYFNTVGSKEGWAPSTFVSSRQGRTEKVASRPEDFMDDEDLSEYGIAPKEIVTTDEFASKTKDRIREKARELASVSAPIPGATILEDLIAPAKITIGIQLLRQMGWKEGQGVGPRTKRRAQKQKSEINARIYGCALPQSGSDQSEDEEYEYLPENVTFAPKDVIPIDFTIKDNVRGLGYRGLDPRQALFGFQEHHVNLFGDCSEKTSHQLCDVGHSRGRKVGMSGQAFGVCALEDEDVDIYGLSKELQYVGNVLDGFCAATKPCPAKKVYAPSELPKDYHPVHYFRPAFTASSQSSPALHALLSSSQKPTSKPTNESIEQSRHHLDSYQRRQLLGETPLQGPASIMELLSDKDRERIKEVKQAADQQRFKAQKLAEVAIKKHFHSIPADEMQTHELLQSRELVPAQSGDFRPFVKNPEKQNRYEHYIKNLRLGQKDALESCLDANMTEWERGREREEFMRSAMLYKSSSSTLSSRFTRAKYDDETDKVEVPRDEEGDMTDKAAAVKMKMFGRLTRDNFEWHPDKLLCKRFNIPDPYPGSTIVGLPKVKRDKFSVFNFLTITEIQEPNEPPPKKETLQQNTIENKPRKLSRWDKSVRDEEESILDANKPIADLTTKEENKATKTSTLKVTPEHTDELPEEEEKRPPVDLFKAIFADSSDEESSSEPELETKETPHYLQPNNTKIPERQDVEEEFGPKMLLYCLQGVKSRPGSLLPNVDEVEKKQKHKKYKEKHKLKKGHKNKKEKKKKHKKQKHKSKQRSKKAKEKSSESESSSTSLSDAELSIELTPKELLKRLKNLPTQR